jgi:PRTRC genetic system protein B
MEPEHQTLIQHLLGNASQKVFGEVKAALYFLEGQYLFCWQEEGQMRSKLVSPEAARIAFEQEPMDSHWMPEHIIRAGVNLRGEWIVQFIPPQRYAIEFDHAQIIVPLPGLIFTAVGSSYYLWAIKEKTFTAEALAYHAPLPNISAAGKLCLGTNRPPVAAMNKIEPARQMFFSARFNSDLSNGKSQKEPDNIIVQLQAIARTKRRTYPLNDLIPLGHSIDRIVSEVIHAR